ncbi:unnamed protein product [Rhizoctonia solani]|uniref:Uncharacterized protein n=1 Tax=Rhizoctonia solani TaxID=456999 RepID=A0A8H2X9M8_9AGAM|nr:unnamed protein product [Rhizoctonia solani]
MAELRCPKIAQSGTLIHQLELLVPIRLETHFRLKDTFTWDLNGTVIAPEIFAQCLCDDYQISSNSVVQAVAKSITEQLQEHRAHIVEPASGPRREDVRGEMSEVDQEWWAKWRRREDVDLPKVETQEKEKETKEELRVIVKVDMIAGTMNLSDQFESDVNDLRDPPEESAEV